MSKEFEKWWEEKLDMHWSHYDKGVCYCAWHAALKWVLTNKKPIKYNAYKFDYIKTDVIEEELEDLE